MTEHLTNEQERAKPYADRSFVDRLYVMGDQAEAAFERWATPRIFQRVGWNKSPLPKEAFWALPAEIRHLPDYLLWDKDVCDVFGGGTLYWVECIGTASGLGFKIRKTKLEAQEFHHRRVPLIYFIYHSPSDSYATMTWDEVHSGAVTPKYFSDGNAYYEIGVNKWQKV